jgi:hypothetical protein
MPTHATRSSQPWCRNAPVPSARLVSRLSAAGCCCASARHLVWRLRCQLHTLLKACLMRSVTVWFPADRRLQAVHSSETAHCTRRQGAKRTAPAHPSGCAAPLFRTAVDGLPLGLLSCTHGEGPGGARNGNRSCSTHAHAWLLFEVASS